MVSCVKRPFDSQQQAQLSSAEQMLQTVIPMGLTYVSLFIEPYNADRHTRPMVTAIGATQTLMYRQGDWWVTVMGDVPASTLRLFAAGLQRRNSVGEQECGAVSMLTGPPLGVRIYAIKSFTLSHVDQRGFAAAAGHRFDDRQLLAVGRLDASDQLRASQRAAGLR